MALIERPAYLTWLHYWQNQAVIKVLTGVRRAGKSTVLHLFRRQLRSQGVPADRLVTINLENPDVMGRYAHGLALYDRLKVMAGTTTYIFIEEAQHLQEFERTVGGLAALPGLDVYVTSSSSDFLAHDPASRFSGLYAELQVWPLSYAEFITGCRLPDVTPGHAPPDPWSLYLRDGGFPYATRLSGAEGLVREYLTDLLNTVVLRDIAPRQLAFSPMLFDRVNDFMFANVGNPVSVNRIAKTLMSQGRTVSRSTIDTYLRGLTESYLFFRVPRYDMRGKAYLENSAKYYAVDLGLRRALLGGRAAHSGRTLENLVYLELRRRQADVSVGKVGPAEISFIADDGETTYIQVCPSVADPAVLERALAPLRSVPDHHPRLLLVGDDQPPADHRGVRQLSVRDWLSGLA